MSPADYLAGGGLDAFLASGTCRGVIIPAVGAIVSVVARWNMRDSSSGEKAWEIFALGPDLTLAGIMAIPALLIERAIAIDNATSGGKYTQQQAEETFGQVAIGAAVLVIFLLALVELSYERAVGKPCRKGGGVLKPLTLGVLIPGTIGSMCLAFALLLVPPS
ncbi:hypothetical protein ACHBTE_08695 [Streptomyces sp. M41]|uniref:hypothetical protein n=1 Tax=Streptomyces sp. M41 TaxID=3059412 RepID=UPI00374D339A